MRRVLRWFLAGLAIGFTATAQSQVELMEANPWDSNMTHQVVWETTPGVRYELQESGSLATNYHRWLSEVGGAREHAEAWTTNVRKSGW